jgi:hypothetical protein
LFFAPLDGGSDYAVAEAESGVSEGRPAARRAGVGRYVQAI